MAADSVWNLVDSFLEYRFRQERIEPAKPAREHATSIDGEIQTLASGY